MDDFLGMFQIRCLYWTLNIHLHMLTLFFRFSRCRWLNIEQSPHLTSKPSSMQSASSAWYFLFCMNAQSPDPCSNINTSIIFFNSLLSRDVTSILSVQMVVKGKWQGRLLLQNIYMYMIMTLEVVYDHVGKCRKLALCYFILCKSI